MGRHVIGAKFCVTSKRRVCSARTTLQKLHSTLRGRRSSPDRLSLVTFNGMLASGRVYIHLVVTSRPKSSRKRIAGEVIYIHGHLPVARQMCRRQTTSSLPLRKGEGGPGRRYLVGFSSRRRSNEQWLLQGHSKPSDKLGAAPAAQVDAEKAGHVHRLARAPGGFDIEREEGDLPSSWLNTKC